MDTFPYDETVGSVLLLRRLNGLAVDEAYLDDFVDCVLIPAIRATASAEHELPAGIFSGSPAPHVDPIERNT